MGAVALAADVPEGVLEGLKPAGELPVLAAGEYDYPAGVESLHGVVLLLSRGFRSDKVLVQGCGFGGGVSGSSLRGWLCWLLGGRQLFRRRF